MLRRRHTVCGSNVVLNVQGYYAKRLSIVDELNAYSHTAIAKIIKVHNEKQ